MSFPENQVKNATLLELINNEMWFSYIPKLFFFYRVTTHKRTAFGHWTLTLFTLACQILSPSLKATCLNVCECGTTSGDDPPPPPPPLTE